MHEIYNIDFLLIRWRQWELGDIENNFDEGCVGDETIRLAVGITELKNSFTIS